MVNSMTRLFTKTVQKFTFYSLLMQTCVKSHKLANFSGKRVQAWLNEQVLGGRHNKAGSFKKFT